MQLKNRPKSLAVGWLLAVSFCLALIFCGFLMMVNFFRVLYMDAGIRLGLGVILIAVGVFAGHYAFLKCLGSIVAWLSRNDYKVKNGKTAKGPKVVVVGGGTGLGTILRGLKEVTSNLTAIVTVADDGGSSGQLRKEFGILPPGDIRNCLVAMADIEPLMERLMQYRFAGNTALAGHNFGNLFLTVMTDITGDFEQAIKESSKVLAVRGQVLPATLENVTL